MEEDFGVSKANQAKLSNDLRLKTEELDEANKELDDVRHQLSDAKDQINDAVVEMQKLLDEAARLREALEASEEEKNRRDNVVADLQKQLSELAIENVRLRAPLVIAKRSGRMQSVLLKTYRNSWPR